MISMTYNENKKFFYGARSKWEKSGKLPENISSTRDIIYYFNKLY
jgi:hypothetical protein